MTWTYSSTSADLSNKDAARLLIGDTSTGDQLLQDEEINWLLSEHGNVYIAAAEAAKAIAAKFARQADKEVGDLAIDASQKHTHYLALSATLRRSAAKRAGLFVGGISKNDMKTRADDTDRIAAAFTVGMWDNPGVPSTST